MSAPCGTYAGFLTHRRRQESPCEACRQARNAYSRESRRSDRPSARRQKAYNAARSRALTRLGDRHRAEFLALLSEELAAGAAEDVRTR